jgi:hypothetical protein
MHLTQRRGGRNCDTVPHEHKCSGRLTSPAVSGKCMPATSRIIYFNLVAVDVCHYCDECFYGDVGVNCDDVIVDW